MKENGMSGSKAIICRCIRSSKNNSKSHREQSAGATKDNNENDETSHDCNQDKLAPDSRVAVRLGQTARDLAMSKPILVNPAKKALSSETSPGFMISENLSAPAHGNTLQGDSSVDKRKQVPTRAEIRYGRAVSQPEEPDEIRMQRFRTGASKDDDVDSVYSPGETAMSRRHQANLRRRNRCLYGVSPHCKFGPKGFLVSSTSHSLTIPDPSSQKLNWTKPPLTVLIIRKHLDESVLFPFRDLVIWLVQEKNMLVYVERVVLEEGLLVEDEDFQLVQDKLKSFREGVDDLTDKVDFIICLGGDGTLLYVSSLFQGSVPPVMAFNMGSLGFLTPFQFYEDFKNEVSRVMQGSASLLLRYRLKCVVVKHDTEQKKEPIPHVKNIEKEHSLLKTHKLVLNEVVVDRGSSSFLSNLDLYIEGRRVTTVQGDGLIISTPTGSTAYAVAAGASMIHPSVPCILLTPICPHSLSFRPVVVPAGVEIKVMLSPGARGTAMVSFDGRDRLEIDQGDSLRITTASYPVPSICAADQIEDWFDGLAVCLNWNLRLHQRPLTTTNSLTSIDSNESDAMTGSQHSMSNGSSDKM